MDSNATKGVDHHPVVSRESLVGNVPTEIDNGEYDQV